MDFDKCTDEQKQLVEQLKAKHADLVARDPVYFDQFYFSRFLVARAWKLDAAHAMIEATKKWRADEDVDTLLERYGAAGHETREFLEKFCPMNVHGVDKRGCPVYVERIGAFDPAGLLASVDASALATHHIYQLERIEQLKRELGVASAAGVPFRKHVVIEDLGGLSWSHMTSATIELSKSLVNVDESYYPELLQKLFIINAPWLFNAAWKILKPLLSERTLNKIEICGADYLEKIQELVDIDELPVEFGGKCTKCAPGPCVMQGGKVPETYHRGGHALDDADRVHDVVVPRSSVHEVRVPVKEGALVCYEFWTNDYDISFGAMFAANDSTARTPVLPVTKHDSHLKHVSGDLTATADGSFVLLFDNSYSMFRKKELFFKLGGSLAQSAVSESDVTKE